MVEDNLRGNVTNGESYYNSNNIICSGNLHLENIKFHKKLYKILLFTMLDMKQ